MGSATLIFWLEDSTIKACSNINEFLTELPAFTGVEKFELNIHGYAAQKIDFSLISNIFGNMTQLNHYMHI